MKIIYVHHALREIGNSPTQDDKIPASENMPFPWVPSCSPIGFEIDKSCF